MSVFHRFGAAPSKKMTDFLYEDRSLDWHSGKRKDAPDNGSSIDTSCAVIDRDLIELGHEGRRDGPARCVFSLGNVKWR